MIMTKNLKNKTGNASFQYESLQSTFNNEISGFLLPHFIFVGARRHMSLSNDQYWSIEKKKLFVVRGTFLQDQLRKEKKFLRRRIGHEVNSAAHCPVLIGHSFKPTVLLNFLLLAFAHRSAAAGEDEYSSSFCFHVNRLNKNQLFIFSNQRDISRTSTF